MIALNESEKNIVREIVKNDRIALEIVENLDKDDTNNNGWFYKHRGTIALWVFLLISLSILSALIIYMYFCHDRTLSLIFLIGTIIVLLFPQESWASIFDNERESQKVKKERAYLNSILAQESTEIKYPIHSYTGGIIWYFKNDHLMNVKCNEADGISYVIYREHYEISKCSLLKREKFDHLEKTASK